MPPHPWIQAREHTALYRAASEDHRHQITPTAPSPVPPVTTPGVLLLQSSPHRMPPVPASRSTFANHSEAPIHWPIYCPMREIVDGPCVPMSNPLESIDAYSLAASHAQARPSSHFLPVPKLRHVPDKRSRSRSRWQLFPSSFGTSAISLLHHPIHGPHVSGLCGVIFPFLFCFICLE